MLCAISGEAPQVPVASRKSGNVFEKRLIEAYIADHGTDPVTGEELTVDDLVELKTARVVRPRPPTLTSIPALLATFQNEWDALALESYTLKQQLAQTRQELSSALYQYEGALRVNAKLIKERDDARDALSKVTIQSGGAPTNGSEMEVDSKALPEAIVEKVEATYQKSSSTRKKRTIPEGWATAETIQAFEPTPTGTVVPGSQALAVDKSGDLALLDGSDGIVIVYSLSQKKTLHTLKAGSAVTDAIWWGSRAIIALTSGAIVVFEGESQVAKLAAHAGPVTGLALHPSGDLLASVGADKSYILYDLSTLSQLTRTFTSSQLTCVQFHPDGHLLAAGGVDGEIKVFEVKTGNNAANLAGKGPVQALDFSENGFWLASVTANSNDVTIWDLRKVAAVKTLEIGSLVSKIEWDYSGQFLAIAAAGCVAVQQYSKSSKSWSEPLRKAVPSQDVAWGASASTLVALSAEGEIILLA